MKINRHSRLGTGNGPRVALLGRRPDPGNADIATWRRQNNATIAQTASHFGVSEATVKRYCATAKRGAVTKELARLAVREGEKLAEARIPAEVLNWQRIVK